MNSSSGLLGTTATFVKLAFAFAAIASIILPAITLAGAFFPGVFASGSNGFEVSGPGMKIDLSSGVNPGIFRAGLVVSFGLGSISAFAMLYVFDQLRRLMQSIAGGTPFTADSAGRIRRMGLAFLAAAVVETAGTCAMGRYFSRCIAIPGVAIRPALQIPFGTILTGLIILCLAEAFRYGAKLQEEHDLTV